MQGKQGNSEEEKVGRKMTRCIYLCACVVRVSMCIDRFWLEIFGHSVQLRVS